MFFDKKQSVILSKKASTTSKKGLDFATKGMTMMQKRFKTIVQDPAKQP